MSRVSIIQNFIIIACRKVFITQSNRMKSFSGNPLKGIPYIIMAITLILTSCLNGGKTKITETPTSGNIKILVDESFKPLLETEVYTFTSIYHYANIENVYRSEVDVVNDFMNDSAKVMVTSRKLTDEQIKWLRDTLIVARTHTFAYDAIALVTNRENPDTLIKYQEVKDIFTGKITSWKDINRKTKLDKLRVIFDNAKSGNIRFFKERFDLAGQLPSNFFAVNSNEEVIAFVEKNKDAMGLISVNWISDKDDSTSRSFTRRVNVLAVSQPFIEDNSFYRPQQGFLYDRSYPFVREIYLISRETFTGLGSGFINWACAEQGQRIVLKSGLVPATMPIRLVQIKR
jgi:phosphate transport system substrate-binding protein